MLVEQKGTFQHESSGQASKCATEIRSAARQRPKVRSDLMEFPASFPVSLVPKAWRAPIHTGSMLVRSDLMEIPASFPVSQELGVCPYTLGEDRVCAGPKRPHGVPHILPCPPGAWRVPIHTRRGSDLCCQSAATAHRLSVVRTANWVPRGRYARRGGCQPSPPQRGPSAQCKSRWPL